MNLSKEDKKELKEEINEEKEIPMDDADIRSFLPDAKIIRYSDLKDYRSLEELLPNEVDYIIILYLESSHKGHWVCVQRYDNTFEFFDPYSSPDGRIDEPLLWVPYGVRMKLGVAVPFMTRLFNSILNDNKYKAIYNPIKYQEEKEDVNSCGRHCVFRILNLIKKGRSLSEYYKHMLKLKDKLKLSYDDIVVTLVPDEN
jgi:hypothetical protein